MTNPLDDALSKPNVQLPKVADWVQASTVLILNGHGQPTPETKSIRIAAFDLDDTLIIPKSGGVFPKTADDWKWVHDSVPGKLRAVHAAGARLVIFSNQSGCKTNADKAPQLKEKIISMVTTLGVPVTALLACDDDRRKPGTEMWDMLTTGSPAPASLMSVMKEKHADTARKLIEIGAPIWPGTNIDLGNSYYVGDAAGRPFSNWAGRNKDFSCSDRKFAANVGIDFHTPDAFFMGKPEADFGWDGFGPDEIDAIRYNQLPVAAAPISGNNAELVVMVGFPGSGKSHFARKHLEAHGYVRINRDMLGDIDKCEVEAARALAGGRSVVVDNTNPNIPARAVFLRLASTHNVPARAFVMTADKNLAMHLNTTRARLGIAAKVPAVAIHTYNKKFEMPTCEEGFAEIVSVPVVPDFDGLPDVAESIFYQLS